MFLHFVCLSDRLEKYQHFILCTITYLLTHLYSEQLRNICTSAKDYDSTSEFTVNQSLVVSLVLSQLDCGNATLSSHPDYRYFRLRSVIHAAERPIFSLWWSDHVTQMKIGQLLNKDICTKKNRTAAVYWCFISYSKFIVVLTQSLNLSRQLTALRLDAPHFFINDATDLSSDHYIHFHKLRLQQHQSKTELFYTK